MVKLGSGGANFSAWVKDTASPARTTWYHDQDFILNRLPMPQAHSYLHIFYRMHRRPPVAPHAKQNPLRQPV